MLSLNDRKYWTSNHVEMSDYTSTVYVSGTVADLSNEGDPADEVGSLIYTLNGLGVNFFS